MSLNNPSDSKLLRFMFAISIYVGWYGCAYSGQNDLGPLSIVFPILTWILLFRTVKLSRLELRKFFVLFIVGVLFDFISAKQNLLTITGEEKVFLLPIWLLSMWLIFVASLPLLKSLLKKRYYLAALLGAIFGPLSYYTGTKFKILFYNNNTAIIIYVIFWAIYFPCALYWLEPKKEGQSNAATV
jgi:hypothetical protein